MAPRANWKGFMRLSLVTCPVALFPATSETEKVSFNQINRKTGHRIKLQRVDAETGEDVDNEDIVKGYKIDTDTYLEVTKDELDNIALESNHTIDIDEFVPRSEIDDLYVVRPYYLVPDGKVGHDAYAVIRDIIKATNKVAIARVVLTNREHIIALEARDKGLVGLLLRYPYEVRAIKDYFDDIQDVKITKDMLDLAKHIVEQKSGHFKPEKFEDHYEAALIELINQKKAGRPIVKPKVKTEGNVINLMDALRQSLKGSKPEGAPAAKNGKAKKRVEGQREMLLPIEGKGQKAAAKAKADEKRESAKRTARAPARQKRAG
jgi:DNA end-binding protein Ku